MKIVDINAEAILFDNGRTISYRHWPEKEEENYADFNAIDATALEHDFHEYLTFQVLDAQGFFFGDRVRTFFVPCYSRQDGTASEEIQIFYNGEHAVTLNGQLIFEKEWM